MTGRSAPPRRDANRRVVIVVFDGFESIDAFGPIEVFDHATTAPGDHDGYDIELVAPVPGPVPTSSGIPVTAGALHTLDDQPIDTLLVVGGIGVYDSVHDTGLISKIRELAARSRRVASVCTGAYLLAEAGLLDGRRVTTYWMACDDLQRRYPALEVDPEPIFIIDGDIATSAGVTTGMDLALAFVEQDHSRELALEVARSLVLFLRRPANQAQLSAAMSVPASRSDELHDLQSWVVDNLDADLSVDALADRTHQSPRTFARRFRHEMGTTPAKWIEQLRLEEARRLLEDTHESVDRVARRCGLRPESIRRLFHRHLGVGPTEYRRRFGVPVP